MAPVKFDELIDLQPFQEAYREQLIEGKITPTILAIRLGVYHNSRGNAPDTSRALRMLGLRSNHQASTGGNQHWITQITERQAKRLAWALCLDPVDLGF